MPVLPIKDRGYARPELLVETSWLAGHLDDPNLRIVDVRPADQYAAGHIPAAVSLPAAGGVPRDSLGDIGSPQEFADLASRLGISDGMTVVAYEGVQSGMVVWALRYFGHEDARFLDGGFAKWLAEGRPHGVEAATFAPGSFSAKPVPSQYCSMAQARVASGDRTVVFWDVRSPDEYTGARPMVNLPPERHGHIPNAVNLDWNELFDPASKTMKTAAECRAMLATRGVKPEATIVTY